MSDEHENDNDERDLPEYWWWNMGDDDMLAMLAMITKEGAKNLKLRFYPETELLELVDEDGEPCGSYNQSHTCPPSCE